MVSVLISAQNDERALVRTLSILVQGAVFGLVRDVIVLLDDPSDAMVIVADHAGCQIKPQKALLGALSSLRSDWVLMLEAGSILETEWPEAIRTHIMGSTNAVHFQRSPRTPRKFWERWTKAEQMLSLGVLITRKQALLLAETEQDCGVLAKRAKPRALSATIMPYEGAGGS